MKGPARKRLLLSLAAAVISIGATVAVVVIYRKSIGSALRLASLLALAELVALQLLAFSLRAEAWGLNIRAAGAYLRRREVHAASAVTFLASNFLPALVPNLLRIGLLRRLRPESEATVGAMAATDGMGLLIEALISTLFIAVAVFLLPGISWWWSALVVLLPAGVVATVYLLRRYFRDRRFMRAFDVLDSPRKLGKLTVLLTAVLIIQPFRYYIALHAVGIHASVSEALLAFIATSVLSALPLGPNAAAVAATTAIFGATDPHHLAAAVAAGVVLAASSVVASVLDVAWTPLVLHRVFMKTRPRTPDES